MAQQSWQPEPALTANIFALATNRANTRDKTGGTIDIESLQNRLHKVCYVPVTSAGLNGLLFFSFLLRPLTVLMKQTRQVVGAVKQSILLRCQWAVHTLNQSDQ